MELLARTPLRCRRQVALCVLMCLLLSAGPAWAAFAADPAGAAPAAGVGLVHDEPALAEIAETETPVPLSFLVFDQEQEFPYKDLPFAELHKLVNQQRQTLLETRLEVIRRANTAKLRLDEIAKNSRQDLSSAEKLRKDLDTIKEAQRVLATVLSDILNVTDRSDKVLSAIADTPAAATPDETEEETDQAGQEPAAPAHQIQGRVLAPAEILPTREYMEDLVLLYYEKNQQLTRIVESLDSLDLLAQ